MARIAPALTYTLGVILILWLILGAITLPNAGKWFQNTSASIEQDVIVLPKNSTTLKDARSVHDQWKYSSNIVISANTPEPPEHGLQGILYDRGLSCSVQSASEDTDSSRQSHAIGNNVSKVALIRRGSCEFSQKLINAQLDGASAVVVYDNASFSQDSDASAGMEVGPNTIFIPAFYVDFATGAEILRRLQNLSNASAEDVNQGNVSNIQLSQQGSYSSLFARVTLYPSHKPLLDPWQFALILIGIVLFTSIAIIVAMQCHLWRLSRPENVDGEENSMLATDSSSREEQFWRSVMGSDLSSTPMRRRKRPRLDSTLVNLLPTRVYGELPNVGTEKGCDPEELAEVSRQDTETSQGDKPCVICLDAYAPGEILRQLQCQHEFHRDCIDMWLTKKSASCPLCLQEVEPVAWPDMVHARDTNEFSDALNAQDNNNSAPDLVDVWEHLSRQHSISQRQFTSAHTTRRTS